MKPASLIRIFGRPSRSTGIAAAIAVLATLSPVLRATPIVDSDVPETKRDELPYVFRLTVDVTRQGVSKREYCTGLLVHPQLILTAGHCTDEGKIVSGTNAIDAYRDTAGGVTVSPAKQRTHPSYVKFSRNDDRWLPWDVGYVLLQNPVHAPIVSALPIDSDEQRAALTRRPLLLTGYGYSQAGEKGTFGVKRYAVHHAERVSRDGYFEFDGVRHAVTPGDSGGPVLAWIGGRVRAIGLNSCFESEDGQTTSFFTTLRYDVLCWAQKDSGVDLGLTCGPIPTIRRANTLSAGQPVLPAGVRGLFESDSPAFP